MTCPPCNHCITLPCSGSTGSCRSPRKVPQQQTSILLLFPPRHHAVRYRRGKQPRRAIPVFKSPSSSFVTAAVTSSIRHKRRPESVPGWRQQKTRAPVAHVVDGRALLARANMGCRVRERGCYIPLGAAASLWGLSARGPDTGIHGSDSPLTGSPTTLS